jgi:hypothetical protein
LQLKELLASVLGHSRTGSMPWLLHRYPRRDEPREHALDADGSVTEKSRLLLGQDKDPRAVNRSNAAPVWHRYEQSGCSPQSQSSLRS